MNTSPRNAVKAVARFTLGAYAPYLIFRWTGAHTDTPSAQGSELRVYELSREALDVMTDPLVEAERWYGGHQAICFGCFVDGRIAGICFYWFGERYESRGFLHLDTDDAKLVQIKVAPEMRGRGVAKELIRSSARLMAEKGFGTLFARVWLSNKPSRQAFKGAGWDLVAFVLEINPLRHRRPLRFRVNLRT